MSANCFSARRCVGLSSALWKNGGSDSDAVWHHDHRSDGPGMRLVVGFRDRSTGRGTFEGEFGARHCIKWGLTLAATRPSSQITLVCRLVIIIIYYLFLFFTLGRYDPGGILKITDITKWIRSVSRWSQRQVNCREVIWHWNVARAPSIFETESSFLWLSPYAQKFSYRDHTGAGELMCWVRRVCQWRSVQKYNDHQDQRTIGAVSYTHLTLPTNREV